VSQPASALLDGIRPYLLLLAICLALYLPGLASLPVMDRDEARFAQATRQMLESGDYVVVRFQDDLRAKKPAGIYWLQSAAVRLFSTPASTAVWPYRLPSLLAAVAAVLLTFRFASTLLDRRAALLAALALATSMVLAAEAHQATTDAALLACTTLAQGSLGLIYLQSRGGPRAPSWAWVALWLGIAAGVLVKGPLTPAIVLLTVLTLSIAQRQWGWLRELRPATGLLLVAILVVPWMWAVSHQTQGAFLTRAVQEDLLPKLIRGEEGHWAPPGTHALAAALTLWPASLYLLPALVHAWRQRTSPGMGFALAWAAPSWVMFELVPTKLFHYPLPLMPALTMVIGAWLAAASPGGLPRLAGHAWVVLWAGAGLLLAAVLVQLPVAYGAGFSAWSLPGAVAAVVTLPAAWWFSRRQADQQGLLVLAASAAIVQASLLVGLAPRAPALWVSQRAVATLRQTAPGAALAVAGYAEPSIVFQNGTATQLLSAQQAAAWVTQGGSRVALIEERELPTFTAALPEPDALAERAVIEGFDYSSGRQVRLHLLVPASRLSAGLLH
jgi:4-amino-4-deoxy-L-arabinose transferase-like glycosyltransferase